MDAETDDWLHDASDADKRSHGISFNGCLNILTLVFLALALIGLFAGYPIVAHFEAVAHKKATGSINLGGTNGTGQIPDLNIRQLIDPDTPMDAMTWQGQTLNAQLRSTNYDYHLVFSDEFNEEGRTFWKGDDPFWEAVDIWYGATMDYEWYSPEALNTTGGNLVITMEEMEINNLNFRSGMLQSWNKFCFQGGYIEFNAIMPGRPDTMGYWPGLWTMGNLARPGFLGSTEGLWPYSYEDKCDSGVLANQLWVNRTGPTATVEGIGRYSAPDPHENGGRGGPRRLSSLPGMRFPACTCSGEDHPGPNRHTSRSAPEIDALEAQIQYRNGRFDAYASQSLQMAPFDAEYDWTQGGSGRAFHIYDEDTTRINDYTGGPYQQCASGLARCPRDGYTDSGNRMVRYGFEFQPDFGQNGNSYVTWYVDGQPTWTVYGGALDPRRAQDIGRRLVSTEPMSIILNLAMAAGFQPVRFTGANALTFPAQFLIDYVRVYQRDGQDDKVSCDPSDHPTADYIKNHPELYLNRELISYQSSKYAWPKNELTGC
ncbi:beta-glucan synthesis-associated protein [Tilletia horrida]|nr:beta-glucan synthesis-associated protein [Tilletia horrida]